MKLTSKRLILTPLSDQALECLMDSNMDQELKQAYAEMLAGSKAHPSDRLFYTAWQILLKKDRRMIGDLCFKGPCENGAVEIGYGIGEDYQKQGYATEAAKCLIDWAFNQKGIRFVEAETLPDNAASKRVLEKLGFLPDGEGLEGPRFVLERPTVSWLSICMCLGCSLGLYFGAGKENMALGMPIGMGIGVAIGVMIDARQKAKRDAAREQRAQKRS